MNYQPGDKIKTNHGELTIEEVHINEERTKYKCPHGDGFVYVERKIKWREGDRVRITGKLYGDESHEFEIGEEVVITSFVRSDRQTPWIAIGKDDWWSISEDEAELI